MRDGVSSIGSIIDDGGFDLELKLVSLVMMCLFCCFFVYFKKIISLILSNYCLLGRRAPT